MSILVLGGRALLVRGPFGGWWRAVNTWCVWISIPALPRSPTWAIRCRSSGVM